MFANIQPGNEIYRRHRLQKGTDMTYPLLLTIVSGSAFTDLYRSKIYNLWILAGMAGGIFLVAATEVGTLPMRLALSGLTLALLLPVYFFGGIGAGDVKLLSAVAFFLTRREMMMCLAMSFVIGLLMGLPVCVRNRTLKSRIHFAMPVLISVILVCVGMITW